MKRITSNDIIPGFQFMHAGIPATVKHVSDGFAVSSLTMDQKPVPSP